MSRADQVKRVLPFILVFTLGFGSAWMAKPGAPTADPAQECTYESVIPAKVLPAAKTITVNVFNSTKRVGLASITSIELKMRGFKPGTIDSSSETIPGIAVIRYPAGSRAAADRLAAYVPGALVEPRTGAGTGVDLVLGESFGAIASEPQVKAILAIPSARPVGAGCPVVA